MTTRTPERRGQHRRPTAAAPARPLLLAVVVAALAAAVFAMVHRSLIDDSLITMAYARNLAFGFEWGLIAGETANSATSPLNVIVLAAATLVVRDPLLAVGAVLVVSSVVTAWWLAAVARRHGLSAATPYVGTALLLLNPLLLSTVGLESYLAATLIVGLVRFGHRPVAYGVVSGLAVLTRPDLAVFVLVGALLFAGVRGGLLRAVGAAVVVAGSWHVFSWFALGSAVPDTLLIKTGQGRWASYAYGDGWRLYLDGNPAAAVPAFLPVVAGLLALLGLVVLARRHPVLPAAAVAGVGAAGHYAAYALLSPPPYHWYYAPLISGMTVCLALVLGAVPGRCRVLAGMAAVGLAVPMAWLDLRVGPVWERAPLSSNWASNAQYAAIGTDLREIVGTAAVHGPGEIGALAYHCGCAVVDQFSDRGIMVGEIAAREARSGPLTRALLAANYTHLDRTQAPLPVAYRLYFEAGQVAEGERQWPARPLGRGPRPDGAGRERPFPGQVRPGIPMLRPGAGPG